MKRRGFLKFLGLAPAVALPLPALPEVLSESAGSPAVAMLAEHTNRVIQINVTGQISSESARWVREALSKCIDDNDVVIR